MYCWDININIDIKSDKAIDTKSTHTKNKEPNSKIGKVPLAMVIPTKN